MKISISMHDDVVARITERAKAEHRSRSNIIELIVLEYMAKLTLPAYVPFPTMQPGTPPQVRIGVAPMAPPYVVTCGGNHATQEE